MRFGLLLLRYKIKARYRMRELKQHPILLWHWSSRWDWFAVLLIGGLAFAAVNEFAVGIFLMLLSMLSLSSKLWHTNAHIGLKLSGTIAIGVFMCLFIAGTVAYMEDKPWSNIPVFWSRFAVIHEIPREKYPSVLRYFPTPENWAVKQPFETNFPNMPATAVNRHPEKSMTEVAIEFAGRDELTLQLADTTAHPADRPKYWFGLVDATNCFVWPTKPDDCQPLPLQTQTYKDDYINGMGRLGPYDVMSLSPSEIAKQHIKTGDVIVGVISATCFNCLKARRYYIYFKVGEGGWFQRVPNSKDEVHIPQSSIKTIPEAELQNFLDTEVPQGRISIPERFDYKRATKSLP
jgi:hypothetical protein